MTTKITSIHRFHKEYDFLNNKYYTTIPYEGKNYPSLYHAFIASKTENEDLRQDIANSTIKNLDNAFHFIGVKEGWHAPTILKDLLFIKFGLVPYMEPDERMTNLKKLAGTGFANLVYGNTEHDNYFGMCLCDECATSGYKNILGYALGATREVIRHKIDGLNNIYRKCDCDAEPTRHILYSKWWNPLLEPSCETHLPERLKKCMDMSKDGYLVLYPIKRDSPIEPPILKAKPMFINKTNDTITTTTATTNDCSDDFCGMGWYNVQAKPTIERKWESMIWKTE